MLMLAEIRFEPMVSKGLLSLLWFLAVAFCLFWCFYRPILMSLPKRMLLALGHFIPLAMLIFVLHGPVETKSSGQQNNKARLKLLVDRSISMDVQDGYEGASRVSQALSEITEVFPHWQKHFDVEIIPFSERLGAPLYSLPSDNKKAVKIFKRGQGEAEVQTNIAAALKEVLSSSPPPDLMLLISDGAHNSSGSPEAVVKQARAMAVPVFTRTLGKQLTFKDLGLELASSEELSFVGNKVQVPIRVTQKGYQHIEVTVKLRDDKGKILASKKVVLQKQPYQYLTFEIDCEKKGVFSYQFELVARNDERTTLNNRRALKVRVIDDRINILSVEGKPYWDNKFLVKALRQDETVALTTLVKLTRNKAYVDRPVSLVKKGQKVKIDDGTWRAPKDATKAFEDKSFLAQFQIIIVGREMESFFSPAGISNLKYWIERGGHFVCARGRPTGQRGISKALNSILPVTWANDKERYIRMQLTKQGAALSLFKTDEVLSTPDPQVILKSLPALVTATRVEKEKALSVILARVGDSTESMAAISSQRYGSGSAVVIEGQGMWQWAFQMSVDGEAENPQIFRAMWANLLRWMVGSNEFLPSQNLSIHASKPIYSMGEKPLLYISQKDGEDILSTETVTVHLVPENHATKIDGIEFPLELSTQKVLQEKNMLRASVGKLPPGIYRARVADSSKSVKELMNAETVFEVMPPLKEFLDVRARPGPMAAWARSSDGKALKAGDLKSLNDLYFEYNKHYLNKKQSLTPIWDRPWVLFLFCLMFVILWFSRRMWGSI
jgi:hypothetical protein